MTEERRWLELYTAHRQALIKYATPIVGDRARAEDIVQDAFLRVTRPTDNGERPVDQPIAYLYRTVRNLAFDLVRRQQTQTREEQDGEWWLLPRPVRTPEQDMIHQQNLRRMEAVLAELELPVRLALEMSRFGGYTLQQIADRLGVSVATAHRMVRGAMVKLALALEKPDQ